MSRIAQAQFKSRLGNLLINKGLVTEQQLAQAVDHQKVSGLRLGEALVSLGILTDRQISKALRRQSSIRFAATLATAMMMPFQVVKADAARIENDEPPAQELQNKPGMGGLEPLNELEMDVITAQGLREDLLALIDSPEDADGYQTMETVAKIALPVLAMMEADTYIEGVEYDGSPTAKIHDDGSIELAVPTSIGEVRYENLRVAGAPKSQSFGDITLKNIDFSGTRLVIRPRT
ncbi:hypothetical protein [Litoribrevibacter albus]|uniref:Type II secretion system protein GspE N-terminal domain-containing protein n=1 Tax=Litoribrevibacter albus TaxID=1473156 RepID=A0AA37W8A2_9GAMM|nr:hypothetical protein [Litoribrevibacter albus]GLQ33640.1 hypothetical protein GCM10007876_41200 [Litoribrevibacter albus]